MQRFILVSRRCVEGVEIVEADGMPSIRGASERWGRLDRAESEAQDARIARFSFNVRSGSLTTSDGWENAPRRMQQVVEVKSFVGRLFQSIIHGYLPFQGGWLRR